MNQLILSLIVMIAVLAFLVFAIVGLVIQTKRRREITDNYNRIVISRFLGESNYNDIVSYESDLNDGSENKSLGDRFINDGFDINYLFCVPSKLSNGGVNPCQEDFKYDISNFKSKDYSPDYFYVPRGGCHD